METLAKSDIFFFITAIAVIVLTIMGLVILFYGIRLFRTAVSISKKIKEEGDSLSNDLAAIRAKVSEEGFGVRILFKIFSEFFGKTIGKVVKSQKKKAKKENRADM